MNKLKNLHNKFIWLELILLIGWTSLMCIYIAPSSFLANLKFMLSNPLLILLNTLPVAIVLIILYFLTGNSFLSGGITNIFFGLLNYTNLLKIDGRDDPFVPGDIALLREALKATGDYRLDMHWGIVALILISSAIFIILGIKLGRGKNRTLRAKLIAVIICAAIFVAAYATLYRSAKIHDGFPVSSQYNISTVFNELGFNYCFIYNLELYTVDKPDGYSEADVEKWIDDYSAESTQGEKPQVLMIMCEAFTDLNAESVFTYTEEENPLYSYWQVKNSPNCIDGSIVVPNFGAGTANTEFDVLTGMQTNLISRTSNSAMRSFHGDIPSIATVFADAGYSTFYMHPGDSWFYNRDSALSHLGIQNKLFVEDMENQSFMDDVFLDNLTAELESRTANGEKLFTYSTTIQNHQAYTYSKYDFEIPPVQCSADLSPEAEEYLSVYSYGIKCSSDMLLELTGYLNAQSEPYILVFFGDHRPNLGPDYLSYRELGLDIGDGSAAQLIDSCTVPFIIWANDAYLDGRTMAEAAEDLDLPADGRISASFLGEITLELSSRANDDPFYRFLSELRREMPVIKQDLVIDSSGAISDTPTDAQSALVDKLHCWQYSRIK